MAGKLAPKDVAIIGLGWTGSILAHELAQEGLDIVALDCMVCRNRSGMHVRHLRQRPAPRVQAHWERCSHECSQSIPPDRDRLPLCTWR